MINFLNKSVWCKLAPSPLHGIGVFAIRDISKGQKMYCQSFKRELFTLHSLEGLLPEIKVLILQRWPIVLKGRQILSPNDDARLISFMNHSNIPNYNKFNDIALRDIKVGEEILEDYGYEFQQFY